MRCHLLEPEENIIVPLTTFFLRQEQIPQKFCNAMCGERRNQAHDFDPKEWNPVFQEKRNFKGDEEYKGWQGSEEVDEVEDVEDVDDVDDVEETLVGGNVDDSEDDDGILDLLRYYEDPVSAPATQETAKFCGNVQLDDLKNRSHTAGNKFAAWMDDRSRSGEAREYSKRLAAIDLYHHLKDGVCDKPQNVFLRKTLTYVLLAI